MLEDYATSLLRRFSGEAKCREYLAALRWPEGFVCPQCQETSAWRLEQGFWLCRGCRHQALVTAGTVLQDSHVPPPSGFTRCGT
jgi:ribosomal protein L37AE/L43A